MVYYTKNPKGESPSGKPRKNTFENLMLRTEYTRLFSKITRTVHSILFLLSVPFDTSVIIIVSKYEEKIMTVGWK
jgi:hypothetical protein